jgi:hypothetical protein
MGALVASIVLAVPVSAAAVESVPATTTAITTVTVEGYDVDFTLPTAAKAGCMVCHGDADLSRLKDGRLISYYIDPGQLASSAHETVQCVGCHIDFAFKAPHAQVNGTWQTEARSACKNCHKDQFMLYGRGAHRIELLPGGAPDPAAGEKPLCGDCHGSHDIQPLTDSPEGKAALHAQGFEVCGRCHEDYWDTYDDYYHGAAYKRGAVDAPACWDCHGFHDVLPADDRDSMVNERHIVETCAQCHPDANEAYTEYAKFVHGRREVADKVFLAAVVSWVRDTIGGLFGG